jgi:two-component system, NarL family, sensor histidine kinase UhpB
MPNKGDYKILVIEDNPGDFALVDEFLLEQIESPKITQARDFNEAQRILTTHGESFDVIFLDLSLPDKTGIPLIKDVLAMASDAAVIVLTGYSDLGFGARSLALGVSDYLLKDELSSLSLYKSLVYGIERRRVVAKLEESEKRAHEFAQELNQVVEEERARIAREIHDEFGQQLSGLKMMLSSLKRNTSFKGDTEEIIDTMVADVDGSIQTLRRIASELRPVLIDKLGLFAAIEWLVSEFEKKTGISCDIHVDIYQPVIDKVAEINLFRICQEAFTNITKHSGATLVKVDVFSKHQDVFISIFDNGSGMSEDAVHKNLSMGLLNMKERASLIGAELSIVSSPKAGTQIKLKIGTHAEENTNSGRPLSNPDRR